MNKKLYKISSLPTKHLPILSDEEAGKKYFKWSYVNIYFLKELKDVYLVSILVDIKNIKEITKKLNELIDSREEWEERKVLEYLNALVKFGLLDLKYEVQNNYFKESRINEELSYSDIENLRRIFFQYFRFQELSSWFIRPEKEIHSKFENLTQYDLVYNSRPLYFYIERNRFTDTFLTDLENCEIKYVIENDILMRFWDVYLKWGTELKILEKYNLSSVSEKYERISIAYFIKPFIKFDLVNFLLENFNTRFIWIPELILKISEKYRFSVDDIKTFIISEIKENNKLTYERTSEIFLIGGRVSPKKVEAATYLFPIIKDSYISTLILRK